MYRTFGLPIASAGLMLLAAAPAAQQPANPGNGVSTFEDLEDEIEALRAEKVAWREIRWKTCLIEGLKKSRDRKKPLMLWIFIDRPIDDERC